MMTKKEKSRVPELRFPGFEGEWEDKELRKSASINPKNDELPDSFIYVDLESVNNGVLDKEERVLKKDAPSRAQRLLERNDILYQTVRPYQKNNLYFDKEDKDYVASTGYAQIRTDNNSRYLYQYIHTDLFVNKVLLRCTGTSYPAINSTDLSKIKVSIPSKEEQQKIATFLTSIDTRIQQLEKKKPLLEQYKKGVMQKIFSQEIRFKRDDGEEFPKWELVKLKKVLQRSTLKNIDDKVKAVLTNSATQGIVNQNEYFDKDVANQNNLQGYYVVEVDDFIYNPRISQSAPVGPFKRNKLRQGVMSPLYTVLTPKNSSNKKGNLDYLEFYFETTLWHKYMKSVANYGARHDRMNIVIADFENLPILFPCIEEQTKIAHFLSALDRKITVVNEQVELTKEWKKGLLQGMFV